MAKRQGTDMRIEVSPAPAVGWQRTENILVAVGIIVAIMPGPALVVADRGLPRLRPLRAGILDQPTCRGIALHPGAQPFPAYRAD